MTPGFLVSALAGWAAALLIALAAPRRRGGWAWTMIAGLIGGGVSGFALHELGAGELGGAPTLYAPADNRAIWTYSIGGVIGGVSAMVLMLLARSMFYSPNPIQAGSFADLAANLREMTGGASSAEGKASRISPQSTATADAQSTAALGGGGAASSKPASPQPASPKPPPGAASNRKALSRMGP